MPKLPRVTVVQFGSTGSTTNFGQFGSKVAGTPQFSQNPAVLQQLAAWVLGWTAAAVGAAFNPYLEDMNAFCFVIGYFVANMFERGIPDYDAGTTYYKGAYVGDPAGSGQIWFSLTDNNLGNTPPLSASNSQWQWANPPTPQDGGLSLNAIPVVSAVSPTKLTNGPLSTDGTNVVTSQPIKFPDATIQSTAAVNNAVTVQTVFTSPTRVFGAVYQNTTGKPLFLSVTAQGSNCSASIKSDSSPTPSTVLCGQYNNGAGGNACCMAIILPGNYYQAVMQGSGSQLYWTEWH